MQIDFGIVDQIPTDCCTSNLITELNSVQNRLTRTNLTIDICIGKTAMWIAKLDRLVNQWNK